AAEVDAEPVRRAEAVLQLAEQLLVVDDQLRLEVLEQDPRLLEAGDGVDGRVARVLAARLDVEVHLAHLQRPLHDRVEILLLDLSVGAETEIVRELTDVLLAVPGVDDVREQAVAETARTVEVLDVDLLYELLVLRRQLVAFQQRVENAVDVLGDRALLRAPVRPRATAAPAPRPSSTVRATRSRRPRRSPSRGPWRSSRGAA